MNIKLRNILLISLGIFIILILFKVTGWYTHIFKFFKDFGVYIIFLGILIGVGLIIYYFFYYKKSKEKDMVSACWQFLTNWWDNDMGQQERVKLKDGIIEEGYYGSGATYEKFIGFNVTKMGSSRRIVFVIGTSPMRIAFVDNSVVIGEHDSPFKNFSKYSPVPVPGMFSPIELETPRMEEAVMRRDEEKKKPKEDEENELKQMKGG